MTKEQHIDQSTAAAPAIGGKTAPFTSTEDAGSDVLQRKFTRRRFGLGLLTIGGGLAAGSLLNKLFASPTEEDTPGAGSSSAKPAEAITIDATTLVAKSQNSIPLTAERARELAAVPPLGNIGDRESPSSPINPDLQKRAREAGYELKYQADPNDTTGRSVLAGKRQAMQGADDMGFGFFNGRVTGIFEGWSTSSENPNIITAILKNPLTKEMYAISINLAGELIDTNPILPTRFHVDDLDYGPEIIRQKSAEKMPESARNGTYLYSTSLTPEGWNPRDPSYIIRNMLSKEYAIDDLAKRGDFVSVALLVDMNKIKPYAQDKFGISIANSFSVRRFGGFSQWKNETASKKT